MNPQRVIRSYLAIAGLYTLAASLIWGVNTLFLLDAGLDIFAVFLANSAFTAGMVLFEIPTGVVADTSGRRVSFLLSLVVLFFSTIAYLWLAQIGAGVIPFMVASVFIGLGFTFYSGAVEAWLVDALEATGYEGELDTVFARGQMISGAAMLVGTVAGGLLGTLDLAVPYLARATLLVGLFLVAYRRMQDVGFSPRALRLGDMPAEMTRVARNSIAHGWNEPSIRLFMFASFFSFGFLIWGFYAWQPYFLELLGSDAVWVAGVIAALVATATIVGNTLVEWLARVCGTRTNLMLWASAAMSVGAVGTGVAGNFYVAVGFFLLAMGAMGVMTPVKQAYLHQVIPSDQRATVISFDSMFGSLGGVASQTGLGYLSRVRSIAAGYVVGGIGLTVVFPLLWAIRRLREPADLLKGRSGIQGPCAAQGIAQVGHVDSVRRQPVEAASS